MTYTVDLSFHIILFMLSKEQWLDDETAWWFKTISKTTKNIITDIPRVQQVDFSSLLEHLKDWAENTEITSKYIQMMDACFVYYNSDVGLVLRCLWGRGALHNFQM